MTFNYPGQANTIFPPNALLNNDWIADRCHELFIHAEASGQMLLRWVDEEDYEEGKKNK
jgi:hypothetical protein